MTGIFSDINPDPVWCVKILSLRDFLISTMNSFQYKEVLMHWTWRCLEWRLYDWQILSQYHEVLEYKEVSMDWTWRRLGLGSFFFFLLDWRVWMKWEFVRVKSRSMKQWRMWKVLMSSRLDLNNRKDCMKQKQRRVGCGVMIRRRWKVESIS